MENRVNTDLQHFFLQLGGFLFLVGCVFVLFSAFVTVPFFNRKFNLNKKDNPLGQDFLIGFPSVQYALMIVFRKRTKKSKYNQYAFDNFDFREHARLIDKLIAFCLVITAYGGMFFIGISIVFRLFSH